MKLSPVIWAASLFVLSSTLAAGCGDDSTGPGDTGGMGGATNPGTGGNGNGDGGSDPITEPRVDCNPKGEACETGGECCSGVCNVATGECAASLGSCSQPGVPCGDGTECCTLNCQFSVCQGNACTPDGTECSSGDECCSGRCDGGTCADGNDLGGIELPPYADDGGNPSCKTSGNPCESAGDCCSGLCGDNGICLIGSSYCIQHYDSCSEDSQCCQGICAKAEGASRGVCVNRDRSGTRCSNLLAAGEVCGSDCSACCSRACAPYGSSGVNVCQPPSGCRPEGEFCGQDVDCCGGDDSFTAAGNQEGFCGNIGADGIGACNKTGCTPHGAICGFDGDGKACPSNINSPQGTSCCQPSGGGKEDLCALDKLLIPRCDALQGECVAAGEACGTSADCCGGLPCVQDPDGNGGFICYDPPGDETCVPSGGPCTNDGDCCVGSQCLLEPGDATGTCGNSEPPPSGTGGSGGTGGTGGTGGGGDICAAYGQSCEEVPCCDGVTCNDGLCLLIR